MWSSFGLHLESITMHLGEIWAFSLVGWKINVLARVILFFCVGGQPLTQLFGKEAHMEIKLGGDDKQSHTLSEHGS